MFVENYDKGGQKKHQVHPKTNTTVRAPPPLPPPPPPLLLPHSPVQVQVSVRPVTLHGPELQAPAEVPSVQPAQRQAHAVPGEGEGRPSLRLRRAQQRRLLLEAHACGRTGAWAHGRVGARARGRRGGSGSVGAGRGRGGVGGAAVLVITHATVPSMDRNT